MASNNCIMGDFWTFLSKYGQRFNVIGAFSEERDSLIAKKRKELVAEGYDVDSYDTEYEILNQECLSKITAAEDIWQREKISLEYNKKKNRLAKQYLNIDLNLVTQL